MATNTAGFTSLDDFIPEVKQYCPGAPTMLIRKHLISVIIEFCERTLLLKRDPSLFALEDEIHTYTLKYSGDRYRALDVDSCRLGETTPSTPIDKTTETELNGENDTWRTQTSTKPHKFFLTEDINTIRFYPVPSQDSTDDVVIRSTVTYRRNQTEFDEFIYEKWHEVIQAGAIARLLLINGASWSNPELAAGFSQEYRRGIRNGRKVSLSGTGEYPGRVKPQSYDSMGITNYRRSGSWI